MPPRRFPPSSNEVWDRMLGRVTIEQLRALRAVVEAGTFSGGARKLGRVQAAVSQSIDRLESLLGLRLFDRSGRAPRLTRQGEAVATAAARVESEFESLANLVASLKQGVETSLSIVVDAAFPTAALTSFAKDFAREHPGVELLLATDVLSAVTAHVRDKRSAWGVALEDADMTDLEWRPIAEVRLIPVAGREHPLARHAAPIDAAGLVGSVQIVLGEHGEAPAGATPHAHGTEGVLSPRQWRVVDLATKHALILAGLGWGHMPEHVVLDDLAAGRLVELRLDAWGGVAPKRSLVVVWRRGAVMGPIALWSQTHLSGLCRSAVDPAAHHGP